MASVNKVILVGNLGRDPETRYTTGGEAVTNVSIATTDTWKDKSGEKSASRGSSRWPALPSAAISRAECVSARKGLYIRPAATKAAIPGDRWIIRQTDIRK